MKYQWLWNRFYGGMSQDRILGPEGTYFEGYGVDTINDMRGVRAGLGVNNFATAYGGVSAIYNLNTGPYVVFGGGNTVNYAFPGDLTATMLTNLSGSTDTDKTVYGLTSGEELGQEYLYIFTSSRIHRAPTPLTPGSVNLDYKSFSMGYEAVKSNPININKLIYFQTSNSILIFNTTSGLVSTGITFSSKNERIVGFSFYNDLIRIYTRTPNGSFLYIWDGVKTQPSYTVMIPDIAISGMVNMGNTDYIYGNNSLYAVSGTQYKKIFSPSGWADIIRFTNFNSNGINNRGLCYIPTGKGTAIYGSQLAGFPDSISIPYQGDVLIAHVYDGALGHYLYQYTTSGGGRFSVINLQNFSLFQGKDNQIINPGSTFTPIPYIASNIYTGDDTGFGLSHQKSITEIKIGFKNNTGTSLNFYMRQTQDDAWSLIKNISSTDREMDIYPDELPFRDFVSLQYKVELNTSFVSGIGQTPILYEIKTLYEPIF